MDKKGYLINLFALTMLFIICSCQEKQLFLIPVTVGQFESFATNTGYITDAEKYGWSFVQENIYDFRVVENANWKIPDGVNNPKSENLPVTQVSFNDAKAYCKWSKTRLPSYNEYWELIKDDKRKVISNYIKPITPVDDVNVLGNVWEITNTELGDSIRLAGGSIYCSPKTCNGTIKNRKLYIDKQTGNTHIGFAVIVKN